MGKNRPRRPTWTANLAALIAENIPVRATCRNGCGKFKQVDLKALAAKVGPEFDLWDRHPRCTITEGCQGRITFTFYGRGWYENMRD
jgi:hypothetical protein